MLRVHFTADDIARVRVAAAPDPLWEITNSFQVLSVEMQLHCTCAVQSLLDLVHVAPASFSLSKQGTVRLPA